MSTFENEKAYATPEVEVIELTLEALIAVSETESGDGGELGGN